MIDGLELLNLPSQSPLDTKDYPGAFILKTCQRTLILGHGPLKSEGHEKYSAQDAYQFLLQTICGLKSQILAESEITAQFKDAYRNYLQDPYKLGPIINVLEKLFKDAKEIRTRYLLKVGQQSYAGITKQILSSSWPKDCNILVVGSGALAGDVVKLLQKRYQVTVSARNPEKLTHIQREHQCQTRCWSELKDFWEHATIINTVGADEILFPEDFFSAWVDQHEKRHFIDLSSPSVIETPLGKKEGVVRLENIFSHGVILNEEKQEKVRQAQKAILDLVKKRVETFNLGLIRAKKHNKGAGAPLAS
jgi:glutamyl-tRNA reductase